MSKWLLIKEKSDKKISLSQIVLIFMFQNLHCIFQEIDKIYNLKEFYKF